MLGCGRLVVTAVGIGAALLLQPGAAAAWPQSQQESAGTSTAQPGAQRPSQTGDSSAAFPGGEAEASPPEFTESRLGLPFLKTLALDQKAIWTMPSRVRFEDTVWLVPLAGLTAGLLVTDQQFSRHLSNAPQTLKRYRNLSNYGVASLIGVGGGLYLWGKLVHEDHRRETGILAGEAVLDSYALTTAVKYAARRSRPLEAGGLGRFEQGGTSFPSEHAAAAWSLAGVLAHEYPGPLTKLVVYGLASAVSASRVKAKEHFPSDVLIGSAIGWFVGQQVYRAHHDPELAGGVWETLTHASLRDGERNTGSLGSPYVPLDSWIYPALERLAALGLVSTALSSLKPWTRAECARLTEEAEDAMGNDLLDDRGASDITVGIYSALKREFSHEAEIADSGKNRALRVDSVYSRVLSISGPALTDGFHFGQTISYDYGRLFRRGTNAIAGMEVSATAGPWFLSVRAEYQHAPAAPPLRAAELSLISRVDGTPLQSPHAFAGINRLRLLDAYLGLNLNNWQISFGQQSLSWGPGLGGSMLLSNNAEPLSMFRISRVVPFRAPSIFRFLGPVRVEHFIGRSEGRTFVPRPYIYGQKINFKPSPYFEIGFARTVTIGGKGGDPLTAHNFYRSFFAREGPLPGPGLPGDSRSEVDWTLRIPGLHNYIVLYADMHADDDELPWVSPPRASYRPGLYITHFPGIPKLDFHFEATSTESPGFHGNQGNLNYTNHTYIDGYTNNGFLMANTVGRMGQAYQAWSSYSFSAKNTLQLIYKKSTVDSLFIPGGGSWQDYSVTHEMHTRSGLYVRSFFQYEHIGRYPFLFAGPVHNVTASFEMGITPRVVWH